MRARALCVAAAACAVAVAGCSGSGDRSSESSEQVAAPTPAPTTTSAAATDAPDASTAPAAVVAAETTDPVRVLVTNDDGVAAEGIDVVVRALLAVESPVFEVTVVAPASEQSGQGGNTTPGTLTASEATTASGHPAMAVAGFPADTVIWALDQGGIDFVPDLVVSGANKGQNLGPVIDLSGTVGAARAAAVHNVPAIAVSAGFGEPIDYAASTAALVAYLEEHIAEIVAHEQGAPVAEVISINTPTCATGAEIRGTVEVPLGADLQGYDYGAPADCASTLADPADDVQAYFNGFVAVSPTPLYPAAG